MVYCNGSCPVAKAVNKTIDLNIPDMTDQAPFLCSLRQTEEIYAKIMIDLIYLEVEKPGYSEWTKKLPELNKLNLKRGYPIHIAVLTHKFDSLQRLVKLWK